MQEYLIIKEKMIKIIIYHGHMHKIILNEDIKDKRQNPIERNTKNSGS